MLDTDVSFRPPHLEDGKDLLRNMFLELSFIVSRVLTLNGANICGEGAFGRDYVVGTAARNLAALNGGKGGIENFRYHLARIFTHQVVELSHKSSAFCYRTHSFMDPT